MGQEFSESELNLVLNSISDGNGEYIEMFTGNLFSFLSQPM